MESLIDKIIADKTLLGIVIALTGLLGVVLGSLLTAAKEWLFQRAKTQKEAEYLAIRVVFMLDRFLRECVDVAYDNGRSGSYYPIDERSCPNDAPFV
jgi:hypothetical protein